MTEIRGKYVYDMVTGKTVGKSCGDIKQDEKQDYNYMYARATTAGYWKDTITYSLLKGVECPEQTGTVEQLSFEQIVNLFLQGNMIVDELKIGLEAKGAKDIKVTEKDGMTKVTFQYDNKNYTLQCATDAATSQIDDVTDEITDESIIAKSNIEESGHFIPYVRQRGYGEPHQNGLVPKDYGPSLNEYTAYDYYVLLPQINEYFGYNFQNLQELYSDLTDADKKTINKHPEIFHHQYDEYGNMQYDMNELENFWLEDGGYQMSAEEYYSYLVTQFGMEGVIIKDFDDYGYCNSFEYYALYDKKGSYVFSEYSVKLLMDDLKRFPGLNSPVVNLLGVTPEDNETEIWAKVNFFCNSLGSEDGTTVPLEKFYLILGGRTYEEVVDDLEIMNDSRVSNTQEQKKTPATMVKSNASITLTDKDIEAARVGLNVSTQSEYVAAKTKAYLSKLQEQYPDIYEHLSYYLENWYTNDSLVGDNDTFRLDWYIDSNNDIGYGFEVNRYLLDVLQFAAGIDTENDSYKTQNEKLTALAKNMGATGDYYEIDIDKMLNYLLGDNDKKINFFASLDKIPNEHNGYTVKVSTPEELLYYMQNYRGVNIKLTSDIDLTNYPVETIEEFYGVINGEYIMNDGTSRFARYTITVGDTPFIKDALGAGFLEINLSGNVDNFVLNNYDSVFDTYIKDGEAWYGPVFKSYSPKNLVQKGNTTNSIPIENYNPPKEWESGGIEVSYKNIDPTKLATLQELNKFIQELVTPIYENYFELISWNGPTFKNFIKTAYLDYNPYFDPDNDYRYTYTYAWKDEDTKNAFTKEMLEAIKEIYEKCPDLIKSIGFDGQQIVYTTTYDKDTVTNLNGMALTTGFPATCCGDNGKTEDIFWVGFVEPSVDKVIMLTNPPKVIPNNIPDEMPVDIEGRGLLETNCPGIYVSTDPRGRGVYVWDSKKQAFLKLPESDEGTQYYVFRDGDVSDLFKSSTQNGYKSNGWDDPYLSLLVASLYYGYNRTEDPSIFEKDGKYYQLANTKSWWLDDYGLEGFERQLIEVQFNTDLLGSTGGTNTSTPPAQNPTTSGNASTKPGKAPTKGDEKTDTVENPKTNTEPTPPVTPPVNDDVDTDTDDEIDDGDFYASLAKMLEPKAKALGYEKGDDGNYYFNEGNNIYLCLWNYWTNSFDKYLIATEEDDNVQLETNSQGDFKAAENTLESLFAEANLMARKYEMTPTDDTGVFELNNERYVFDIKKKTFVKEADAVKNNVRTWVQVYREAVKLALELGYKPSSMAFCIFEDSEGNKFKYDADKQKFVEYSS